MHVRAGGWGGAAQGRPGGRRSHPSTVELPSKAHLDKLTQYQTIHTVVALGSMLAELPSKTQTSLNTDFNGNSSFKLDEP